MILYIDGAVRAESRTRELADYLAGKISGETEYVRLGEQEVSPLKDKTLDMRNESTGKGDFSDPYFKYAKQFAKADEVILAAPYWDLSFPAVVKAYLENICVVGLTFSYSDKGIPESKCRAKKLYYVTTAGGTIAEEAYGYGYVKALAQGMFGIEEVLLIKAENLDVFGSNVERIMSEAKGEIDKLFI